MKRRVSTQLHSDLTDLHPFQTLSVFYKTLLLSLITARRHPSLPRQILTASSTLILVTHILILNLFILALSPTILMLISSLPFVTLEKSATDAGLNVLQLLNELEAGTAAATTTTDLWSSNLQADRTQLLVDLGSCSLSLSLFSVRKWLTYGLAFSHSTDFGGEQIYNRL